MDVKLNSYKDCMSKHYKEKDHKDTIASNISHIEDCRSGRNMKRSAYGVILTSNFHANIPCIQPEITHIDHFDPSDRTLHVSDEAYQDCKKGEMSQWTAISQTPDHPVELSLFTPDL